MTLCFDDHPVPDFRPMLRARAGRASCVVTTVATPGSVRVEPRRGDRPMPLIEDADVVPVADGIDIWDSWPIRTPDGSIADVCGHVAWVALAAPAVGDPGVRHNIAEHRVLLAADDGTFVDLGPLFDDGDALGSRQWAGSTVLDGDRLHCLLHRRWRRRCRSARLPAAAGRRHGDGRCV